MEFPQAIINIAEICAQHNLKEAVLSPGSRNAPLTLAFSRHPRINIRVIPDERAAAYIALGIAQFLNQPVVLICTSGTAMLNYGPALAEAFYRNIPLLVLTADRPPEWVDQKDGQTVRQENVFQNHVKRSFSLPLASSHPDTQWHIERTINEAILVSQSELPGPVHVNVPLREPLYPTDETWTYKLSKPITRRAKVMRNLSEAQWKAWSQKLQSSKRPLLLGGQMPSDPQLIAAVTAFSKAHDIPLLGDGVSNLHGIDHTITHLEVILGQNDQTLQELRPDLLISFGGAVISKNLKLFLRNCPNLDHWQVQREGIPADTFQQLRGIIPMDPLEFFTSFRASGSFKEWHGTWQKQQRQAHTFITNFSQNLDFNEMKAASLVLKNIPPCTLHVSNSMPVRWLDLMGVPKRIKEVGGNRGTSGIDGCNSTVVGRCLVDSSTQVLLTGDMAFFYDRNAFWHENPLPNLRIIILNNQGGGIFRLIDGPSQQPECEPYFVTRQSLSAQHIAQEYNFKYLHCQREEQLQDSFEELFKEHTEASVLEISVPDSMESVYKNLKQRIQNNYE